MQFLAPIWFFALAALAVPLAIHLWNTRRGKTLRVGSIAWLLTGNRQNRRSLQLTEWLLLLLRCLLLLALIFFLAGPFIEERISTKNSKGWLLLAPDVQREAVFRGKNRFDSLLKSGYELRTFAPGFDKLSLPDSTKKTGVKTAERNYWTLLRALESRLPPGFPVEIVSDARLAHFGGRKPESPLDIRWTTFAVKDSILNRRTSRLVNDGRVQTTEFQSRPAGNTYRFSYDKNPGENSSVDTGTLQIAVYAPAPDARYLDAALHAIRDFSGRRIAVRRVSAGNIPAKTDWLFWLSEKPLPKKLPQRINIFRYAAGETRAVGSTFSAAAGEPVSLSKIIESEPVKGERIWQDDAARTLLEKDGNLFRFYSRFDPAWSTLVWSPAFAENLFLLVYPQDLPVSADDRRTVAPDQLTPVSVQAAKKQTEISTRSDLKTVFWIALALLVLAERFFAHRRKEGVAHG